MNLNLNLQLSLIVIGVVLLIVIYLVTRWSNRKSPSPEEDHDEDRFADDLDRLAPELQLHEETLESEAGSPRRTGEKTSDVTPVSGPAQRAGEGPWEAPDTAGTDEVQEQRDPGARGGQPDDDQAAEIPVLAVEVMPGKNTAVPGHPVSGEARNESDERKDLRGHGTNGSNDPSGPDDRDTKPDPPNSAKGEAFASDGKDDSLEDEPVFPYPDMLDQKDPHADNLDKEVRVEPTLNVEEDYRENQSEPQESVVDDPEDFTYPKIDGFARLTQIDYWAKIFGDRDVGRETVIAQYRAGAAALSDKCRIYGLKVPDEKWFDVEQQAEGARFNDIVVSIQLAGPDGPVNAWELDKFVRMVEKIAMGTGRHYSFMAEKNSALKQARAIADFVRHYDSVHLVNVKPVQTNYINGREIERAAMRLGLEKGENNFFVRYKKVGKEKVSLYCLINMSETGEFDFADLPALSTGGVIFFSKPAINRSPGAVFAEMADTAKSFASRVQAEPFSEDNQDLLQVEIDRIRRSIEETEKEMQALGLASGSEEAMRIFKSY